MTATFSSWRTPAIEAGASPSHLPRAQSPSSPATTPPLRSGSSTYVHKFVYTFLQRLPVGRLGQLSRHRRGPHADWTLQPMPASQLLVHRRHHRLPSPSRRLHHDRPALSTLACGPPHPRRPRRHDHAPAAERLGRQQRVRAATPPRRPGHCSTMPSGILVAALSGALRANLLQQHRQPVRRVSERGSLRTMHRRLFCQRLWCLRYVGTTFGKTVCSIMHAERCPAGCQFCRGPSCTTCQAGFDLVQGQCGACWWCALQAMIASQ